MIVYAVIGLIDYEGGVLVNVYKNEIDAEKWVREQMERNKYDRGYNDYEIEPRNVIE